MNLFSKKHPNAYLHDLISGRADPQTAANLQARRAADANFNAEAVEFERIRAAMKALPSVPAPRSFRLSSRMAGVKPPKPRPFAWVTTAASVASIVFVLSFGLNTFTPPYSAVNADLAMEAAPMAFEAPAEAPMMAPAPEEQMDAPAAAAFAEMPAEEPAPEDMALPSAPADAPPEISARKMPEEPLADGAPMPDSIDLPERTGAPIYTVVMWISLGLALLTFAGATLGRMIQVRFWREKWKH